MTLTAAINAFKSSSLISWKSTGKLQQTVAGIIEKTGITLHSGNLSTVRIFPESAGTGRYFDFDSNFIPASIHYAQESPLCTTLRKDGYSVRTIEHLLSALEATGVDNCRIQVLNSDDGSGDHREAEVPILDGSAREWVESIAQVGLTVAIDHSGNSCEKLVPFLKEPVHVSRKDSLLAAFPSHKVDISYGISFPEVPAIGSQWFSSTSLDDPIYAKEIAPSRTFCVYEEVPFKSSGVIGTRLRIVRRGSWSYTYCQLHKSCVNDIQVEKMRALGLIKGGSFENAIVFSIAKGLLNPPLRSPEEPCRHKILDLIGDVSLFARCGSQGLPMARIVAYKGGHALHADFVRRLSGIN